LSILGKEEKPGNPIVLDQSAMIAVGIADIKIGKAPQVLRTTLGSCIAVCLYNSDAKVGGMLHFMMATPFRTDVSPETIKKGKYAQTGIPEILRQLRNHFKIEPTGFTAKLFGGANLLPTVKTEIGRENEEMARSILKTYGVRITGAKTGGPKGYRIDMDLSTGKVKCQVFGQETEEY